MPAASSTSTNDRPTSSRPHARRAGRRCAGPSHPSLNAHQLSHDVVSVSSWWRTRSRTARVAQPLQRRLAPAGEHPRREQHLAVVDPAV